MAEIWEEWVCVAYGERMGVWVREYRALKKKVGDIKEEWECDIWGRIGSVG